MQVGRATHREEKGEDALGPSSWTEEACSQSTKRFERRKEKIMFNDGGVLPGIVGSPREPLTPQTHFTTVGPSGPGAGPGCPQAPSESF